MSSSTAPSSRCEIQRGRQPLPRAASSAVVTLRLCAVGREHLIELLGVGVGVDHDPQWQVIRELVGEVLVELALRFRIERAPTVADEIEAAALAGDRLSVDRIVQDLIVTLVLAKIRAGDLREA